MQCWNHLMQTLIVQIMEKKTDCVNTVTSSIKAKNECVFSTCNRWGEINCNWIEAFCKRTACIGFRSHIRFSHDVNGPFFEINLCSNNSPAGRINKYKCQSGGEFKFAPKVYFFYDCAQGQNCCTQFFHTRNRKRRTLLASGYVP